MKIDEKIKIGNNGSCPEMRRYIMANDEDSKITEVLEETSELSKQEKEKIKTLLEKHNSGAKKILSNVEKTQEFLDKVMAKMETVKFKPIAHLFGDVRALMGLVTDTITGKYSGTPYRSIIAITGALIYFLSPIDFIPDFIPVLGFLDDTFVLGLVLKQFQTDLDVYKAWKRPKEEIMVELKRESFKDDPKGLEEFEKKLKDQELAENNKENEIK